MGRNKKELGVSDEYKIIHSILEMNDSYGYEMLQKALELSNDQINWNIGKVYMILKKMEANGLISSYWIISNTERPKKYYRLTEKGMMIVQNNEL